MNLESTLIGMEAYGDLYHWVRELQTLGHNIKLIAPQSVNPYIDSHKNGAVIFAAVGVNLGCGMMAAKTTLNASQLPNLLTACVMRLRKNTARKPPKNPRGA